MALIAEVTWFSPRGGHRCDYAAAKAADAAHQSVELTRQQFEEQAGLGRTMVQAAITKAIAAIEYGQLQVEDLAALAETRALPPTDNLVPTNAKAVIEPAARIDPEAAQKISSAFTHMELARNEIESNRNVQIRAGRHYGNVAEAAADFLDSASDE